MEIKSLNVHNFKIIGDVKIEFDPSTKTTIIAGENGSGKSTLLRAIECAFCGEKEIPDNPIKNGEREANIVIETDKYIITRRFWYVKNTDRVATDLKIVEKDGVSPLDSPQTVLSKVLAKNSINPAKLFSNESPKDFRDMLADLVKFPFSLESHDKERKDIYNERTREGQVADQKLKYCKEIPLPAGYEELPGEPISAAKLNQQYQAGVNHNAEIQRKKGRLEVERKVQDGWAQSLENIKTQIVEEEGRRGVISAQIKEEGAEVATLLDVDTDAILAEIERLQAAYEAGCELNDLNAQRRSNLEDLQRCLRDKDTRISSLKEDSGRLDISKKDQFENVRSLETELSGLSPVDLTGITAKISDIEKTNRAISDVLRYQERYADYKAYKNRVESLTAKLNAHDQKLIDAMAAATFPVPELSFDNQGVTWKGQRFDDNLSDGEKLRTYLLILFAMNPEAKFVVVHNAAILDRKNMAIIDETAKEKGFSVFLERIEPITKTSFQQIVLENGKQVNQ